MFLNVDNDLSPDPSPALSPQVISGLISIQNTSDQYMRVTARKGLEFNGNQFDNKAIFAVRPLGGNKIALISKHYCFSPTDLQICTYYNL
jgi:hypothetical protein